MFQYLLVYYVDIKIVQNIAAYTHKSLKLRSSLVELEEQNM